MYGGKVALLSAVMLGIMPGFFWLSGYAMLETILVFFVTVSLLCFYRWLTTRQNRMLVISGLAFGLGFLAKYQILVVGLIMILCLLLLARKQVNFVFKKLSIVIAAAVLVVTPWMLIAYQAYKSGFLGQWFYVLQTGNPGRSVYSSRFPLPIFYFIEMAWPHSNFHPISSFCYILGLAGLVWLAWRHRRDDKFMLIWFAVIFIFYTLVPNKDWRYVIPLFPILAISASVSVLSLGGALHKTWKKSKTMIKKHLVKIASVGLIIVVTGAMFYSVYETYSVTANHHIPVDIKGATDYTLANMEDGKSIMILLPCNLFNQDMVQFYVWAKSDLDTELFQYPEVAVDAYTPVFNITEFIEQCRLYNVQYVITYEYGGVTVPYYNTDLSFHQVYEQLYVSGNFTHITDEHTFGVSPRRIFVLNFTG
jgi:4-amino-4-deoxy-L-arabinose transferase-like glycosyltransferase